MGLAIQTGWSPDVLLSMPQQELFAWVDALFDLNGVKTPQVSDEAPVDDPRDLFVPEAVQRLLSRQEGE